MREKITIVAEDGRELSARWWPGAEAGRRSLIFIPAIAAPQEYLHFFASHLAKSGWGVLSFDYRSVGASGDSERDASVTLDDWINLDLPAAVAELRRRSNPEFLAAVAHSIGGQLLGQSQIRHEINGALLVAAQRGIPELYKGAGRLRLEYAYTVFPILIRLLGRLPVSPLTLPAACSGRVLTQWIRWGRSGVFTDSDGVNVEKRFDDYTGPLTAVTVADDDHYAPAEAVEALTRIYGNADLRRETIRPREYGLERIGHFGFFRRQAPRELWSRAEGWLRDLEERYVKSRDSIRTASSSRPLPE